MAVIKRRPFRVNFENLHNIKSDDLVNSEVLVDVLKKEVPKAVNKAIKERKMYATVFEINSFGVFVELHKKDWISALTSCLDLYIKQENYEACVEINKTIESLSKKQTLADE
jgi:hypothetical protein